MIYIKVVLALMLAAVGFKAGHFVAQSKATTTIAAKDKALNEASTALAGAAMALRMQSTDNAKRVAEAAARANNAEKAGDVARTAAKAAQAKVKAYDERARTARRRPGCDALLKTDVVQACGRLF